MASDATDLSRTPAHDAEPTTTFVFDVSAGEEGGVGDSTGLRRVDPAMESVGGGDLRAVAELLRKAVERPESSEAEHASAAASVHEVASDGEGEAFDSPEPLPLGPSTADRGANPDKRAAWPACYLSLVVHGTALALLAVMAVRLPEPPLEDLNLVVSSEPLEDVEFSGAETTDDSAVGDDVEALAEELGGGPLEAGEAELGGDAGALALGEAAADALLAGAVGELTEGSGNGSLEDVGLLFGAGSGGGHGGGRGSGNGNGMGEGLGPAPLAKFFGTKIEGRRIAFVLDNSGSMQGGRLETVIEELKRCVDSLARDQEFYVIFYSDTIYPLFYPEPADRYVPATDRNKRLLASWLDTVELCMGDAVIEALGAAAMIEPDVVFLLSDGRVQGEKKMGFLLDARSRDFPIHTVAVGMGGVTSRQNLQAIAEANGGDFREAEVPDDMQELARKNPRPYHSDSPGIVWGRQVRARRSAR